MDRRKEIEILVKDGVCGNYAMVTYDDAQYLIEYVL